MLKLFYPLIAQEGSQAAADVLTQSLNLQQNIQASWGSTWQSLLNPSGDLTLWSALVEGALTLALFLLIYLFIKYGNEFSKTRYLGTIIEMFLMPITVVVFLGNNGILLANTILLLRGVFESILQSIQGIQLAGVELGVAVQQLQLNGLGTIRVRQLLNECEGLSGADLEACFSTKVEEVQGIVSALSEVNPDVDTSALEAFANTVLDFTIVGGIQDIGNFIQGGFSAVIQDRFFPLVQTILYAIQWAFINCLEASILLTAVLAPFALVLSLLPISGKPIWAWASAFLSLYGIKLGYIIVVGVVATVLVNAEGNSTEIASEYGFAFFVSIFSPTLAVLLAGGGGVALFQGISRRASSITTAISSGASTVLTGGFLK